MLTGEEFSEFQDVCPSVRGVYVDTLLLSTPPDHLSQGTPRNPASLRSTFAALRTSHHLSRGAPPSAPVTVGSQHHCHPPLLQDTPATWSSQAIVSRIILAAFLSLCSLLITSRHQNPSPSPSSWFLSQGWPSAQAPFPSKPQGGPCYVSLNWPLWENVMILWL